MSQRPSMDSPAEGAGRGSLVSYVVGFVSSLVLTLAAYLLVLRHVHSGHLWPSRHWLLAAGVVVLAIVQLVVQLVFFLHLSRESKPRWNLTVLLFAALVLLIVVFGSLWIMNNLNYHMVSPSRTDEQIFRDEGVYR